MDVYLDGKVVWVTGTRASPQDLDGLRPIHHLRRHASSPSFLRCLLWTRPRHGHRGRTPRRQGRPQLTRRHQAGGRQAGGRVLKDVSHPNPLPAASNLGQRDYIILFHPARAHPDPHTPYPPPPPLQEIIAGGASADRVLVRPLDMSKIDNAVAFEEAAVAVAEHFDGRVDLLIQNAGEEREREEGRCVVPAEGEACSSSHLPPLRCCQSAASFCHAPSLVPAPTSISGASFSGAIYLLILTCTRSHLQA